MKRRSRALVATVGSTMTVVLTLGLAAPANAAEVDYWSADNQLRGTGYFNAEPGDIRDAPGDSIRACDWLSDGYGIETQLDINPGSNFDVDRTVSTLGHAAGSSGYCTGWNAGNIAEGTWVDFRVCKVTYSSKSCGHTEHGVA